MKQFLLILLFLASCAETQTPIAAKSECQKWDIIIDSAAEFLCAIKHASEHTELFINEEKLVFETPVVVSKALHFSVRSFPTDNLRIMGTPPKSRSATLYGPSFHFEKIVTFDTISFNTKTITTQSASFKNSNIYGHLLTSGELKLENVVLESELDFNGNNFVATESRFLKRVNINSERVQVSRNRFDENLEIESRQNGYVNNNLFLGKNRKTNWRGTDLFVENNCRNPSRVWTEFANLSGNRIHEKCTLSTWCSINAPAGSAPEKLGEFNVTHIKVGDFNGDGTDELVRIDAHAWHHYDFKTRVWSLLRREKNTPPWAVGVADLNGDGKESLIKADGYLIRILSEDGSTWREGAKFEEGFARQYLMTGNIEGDAKSEFVKYNRKTGELFSSKNNIVNWKKETTIKESFLKLEIIDFDGDGFDDLIIHQLGQFIVYDFTKKTRKNYLGSTFYPTIFGEFDHDQRNIEIDKFIDANQIIRKKTKTVFKEKRFAAFVADTNGDGVEEIFSACPSPKQKIRIATYNLNHAGVRGVEELGMKIKRINADFIVLQEIDRNTKRNPYDMVSKIIEYSGYKYYEFFKSNDYQGGEYGLLVLSKSPVKKVKIKKLPAHRNRKEWPEKNVAVSLESGNRKFIVTHIIARNWKQGQDLSKTQDAQIAALAKFVKTENPDFVLGDFNIKPDSEAYQNFSKTTGYNDSFTTSGTTTEAITFPDIHGEPRRIDYIFSRPDVESDVRAEIPMWISSDHYPYIVHFY